MKASKSCPKSGRKGKKEEKKRSPRKRKREREREREMSYRRVFPPDAFAAELSNSSARPATPVKRLQPDRRALERVGVEREREREREREGNKRFVCGLIGDK